MINMNPRTLPVHDKRDPSRRLGWVQVLGAHKPRFISFTWQVPVSPLMHSGDITPTPARELHTTIDLLDVPVRLIEPYVCAYGKVHETIAITKRILAVQGNETDIHKWKKVVGFVEDRTRGEDVFHRLLQRRG